MAKRNKVGTSADVNAYIKKHAASVANWQALRDKLQADLGVNMTLGSVSIRGQRLHVTTQNKRAGDHGAQALPGDPLEARLATILKRRKNLQTVESLSDELDVAPSRVRAAMDALKRGGHNVTIISGNVELSREIPKAPALRLDARKMEGKVFRFGLTADNHLGSKYARNDVLNALFDAWHAQGIKTVYQCGNMIDGEARFNKFDLLVHGMEGQARHFAKHWPQRPGMKTYFVTGDDHEGWYVQREGVEIGRYLEETAKREGRKDLVYLGHMEHDISFEGRKQESIVRLIHAGGGSAYAVSYSTQKIVESYSPAEKPHVLLVGHYHKSLYMFWRGVHIVQAGTTMDQSPFMRKNKLAAHIGGWTIEMTINADGVITKFRQEWMPFWDSGFYDESWRYQDLAAA